MHQGNTKGKKLPARSLDPSEARAIIAAANPRYASGARARAILAVMYRGGLRVSEALALRHEDVDRKQRTLLVQHGKGDKSRLVVVDQQTIDLVDAWLGKAPNSEWLFCTSSGKRVLPCYVRALISRLAKRACVGGRVHPHALRHTHARELAEASVPLTLIRDQLGHAKASTTDAYLQRVAPAQRIAALNGREW